MTLVDKLYEAIKKEYEERQEERRKMIGNNRVLSVSAIAFPCEERAILEASGVSPPVKVDEIGARIHGTLLHEAVENILKKHFEGEIEIEKEFGVKLKNWTILGHTDVILRDESGAEIYDFKFVHPFQLGKVLKSGKPSPQYAAQLNIYQYLAKKNGVPVKTSYLEYINKVKSSITLDRKTGEKIDLGEFTIHEVEVPYDERRVRVYMNHAMDIIDKVERGEPGLGVKETVEKLKLYYEKVGLDPEELEAENYENWACRYCDFREVCPILQAQKEASQTQKNKEVSL